MLLVGVCKRNRGEFEAALIMMNYSVFFFFTYVASDRFIRDFFFIFLLFLVDVKKRAAFR